MTQISVQEEYRKNTGIKPQDISQLRQWLGTQSHLPAQHITDLDLILTYHCCYRSTEVTKQVLDLHYTLRTLFEKLFKNRAVDATVIKSLRVILPLPLEIRAHDDCAILYLKLIDSDLKDFVLHELTKVVFMVFDLWQLQQGTFPGLVLLVDLHGFTFGHIGRMELQALQQFFYFLQEAMLVKLKGFHFINAPSFVDTLIMVLRPFLKKSLLDMIVIHPTGSSNIEKYLPKEGLPKEAGGNFKTLEQARDDIIDWLKANEEFFALENKKRVVEALRPGRPKTISDVFGGVEGSFKKLDID